MSNPQPKPNRNNELFSELWSIIVNACQGNLNTIFSILNTRSPIPEGTLVNSLSFGPNVTIFQLFPNPGNSSAQEPPSEAHIITPITLKEVRARSEFKAIT